MPPIGKLRVILLAEPAIVGMQVKEDLSLLLLMLSLIFIILALALISLRSVGLHFKKSLVRNEGPVQAWHFEIATSAPHVLSAVSAPTVPVTAPPI
jgi:hypothetical protein